MYASADVAPQVVNVRITGSPFRDCSAGNFGGGLAVEDFADSGGVKAMVDGGTSFQGCSAGQGGAVFNSGETNLLDCSMTKDNWGTGNGFVIFNKPSNITGLLNITHCRIEVNDRDYCGFGVGDVGAVYTEPQAAAGLPAIRFTLTDVVADVAGGLTGFRHAVVGWVISFGGNTIDHNANGNGVGPANWVSWGWFAPNGADTVND